MTRVLSASFVLLFLVVRASSDPAATAIEATQGTRTVLLVGDGSASEQRATASIIESMIASGQLKLIDQREDTMVTGRVHSRYQQTYQGLPVLGADVTVQRSGAQIVTAMGIVFEGLALDTTSPALSFVQASRAMAARGVNLIHATAPLSILPAADGSVSLVYTARDDSGYASYINANTGAEMMRINQMQRQSAVQTGTGGLGDSKKVSGSIQGSNIVAIDALRPPAIETLDLQGNTTRAENIFFRGIGSVSAADAARQTGTTWTDSAVVDAHVHAGFVYDYFYRRFQRRGLDNNDVRIQSVVHAARLQDARTASSLLLNVFYMNAFYDSDCRCVLYGEGLPPGLFTAYPNGVRNFATALDVVGHELTHAVTDASSGLIYSNESGALNEAFSDIIGTSVELFYHPVGGGPGRADYLLGEDLYPNGSADRSLSSPIEYQQPDHFSERFYIGTTSSQFDDGGVHVNSGIANNAFYLAIEGGTHRTSRRAVSGVGATNREQIERVFYRAFTSMLPSNGTFYLARIATIQSARDLYGAGSAAERAITDAWTAVGVTSPAAAITNAFSPRSVSAANVSCSGSTARPSFSFRLSLREFQQVGYTVSSFAVYRFDTQGRILDVQTFPATTFRSQFTACGAGSTRIGPGATACANLCADLGGRSAGAMIYEFYGTDDNGNAGIFNTDYLALGIPAINDTTTPPSLRKGVQQ